MIYLDNAATSWPKPESVYQAMDEFLRNKGGNPGRGGHSMAVAANRIIDETRLLLARLVNAPDKDHVILTSNCTDSLNMGLKGLLKPGDHVVTSSIEHNSVVRPLKKLKQQGIKVTQLSPRNGKGVVTPQDMEKTITKETKLVVITHASNVTGVIQPIKEYGTIARKYDLVFMVDAAQTIGKYPIDVQENHIDLLAFSGHKGLFGPMGTGGLYISERVDLDSLREGGTGSHSELEEQPRDLPYKYECGTMNCVGIAGLGAGLKYIFKESIEKILSHEQSLTNRLIDGLTTITRATVFMAEDGVKQAPILSLAIDGAEPGEVGAILDQAFNIGVRTGLHCAPVAHKTFGTFPLGTIRLSPGYYNTAEEIDFTLEAIEKIARSDSFP
jgi:cysteine desulfurase family protein